MKVDLFDMMASAEPPVIFSADRQFRYLLVRRWSAAQMLTWLMLNPSVADEQRNDPTVERCVRRASRLGYGGIRVVNLFALVTPYPWVMWERQRMGEDIVGPLNDDYILSAAKHSGQVAVAWGGDHPVAAARAKRVLGLLRGAGITPTRLGTTQGGQPRHPLYVPYDVELTPFNP
jgi:hypothetical protein